MNKKIIDKIIVEAINKQIELSTKCTNTSKVFRQAMSDGAKAHGLTIEFDIDDEIGVALYDEKNDTRINFTNGFINKNLIDYHNKGDKPTNLEDVFNAYDNLPTKNKKSMNLITFEVGSKKNEDDGVLGYSRFIDKSRKETHSIGIPHYTLDGTHSADLDFVLAHESMHTYDYKHFSKKNQERMWRILNNDIRSFEDMKFIVEQNNININQGKGLFRKSLRAYSTASQTNLEMLSEIVGKTEGSILNASSHYGYVGGMTEDFADAGAMIITGYKNHDNPSAKVSFGSNTMGYREWVAYHPHQAQYLIKELYGDNVPLDELAKLGFE